MLIRISDIILSLLGLIILLPLLLLIALVIIADSRGGVLFIQTRVGKDNKDFKLLKFRTMVPYSENYGSLTVGFRDNRITKVGYFLRKYKIDELPQLINVLAGSMSMVGPRPEVRKYVDLYNAAQKIVLSVKPGITDLASLEYSDENDLLAASDNPEKTYIDEILPAKIRLNMVFINDRNLKNYFRILFLTVKSVIKTNK
jgi:lipopolysaccharide/colanic/teichoic acid biosynthesis glycosyltransferase